MRSNLYSNLIITETMKTLLKPAWMEKTNIFTVVPHLLFSLPSVFIDFKSFCWCLKRTTSSLTFIGQFCWCLIIAEVYYLVIIMEIVIESLLWHITHTMRLHNLLSNLVLASSWHRNAGFLLPLFLWCTVHCS